MKTKKDQEPPEELTTQKLKSYRGLEHLSDEEAQEQIFALKSLATILFKHLTGFGQKGKLNNQLKRPT